MKQIKTHKKLFSRMRSVSSYSRPLLAVACSAALLLTGCSGGGSGGGDNGWESNNGDTDLPTYDLPGAAIDGPIINAVARLYILDFSKADWKGELLDEGITDDKGALTDLTIPALRFGEDPFLIEIEGGTELDGSTPVLSTMRTIITSADTREDASIYATPLSTFTLALTQQALSGQSPEQARDSFFSTVGLVENVPAGLQQLLVKERFGLGLLTDATTSVFTNPAMYTEAFDISKIGDADATLEEKAALKKASDALALRTANAVLVAMIKQLQSVDTVQASADAILAGLAVDQLDGDPDGRVDGEVIDALVGISSADLISVLTQSANELAALPIPGVSPATPISGLTEVMVSELATVNPGLETNVGVMPAVTDNENFQAVIAGSDRDGDKVVDIADDFPDDALRAVDNDNDGLDDVLIVDGVREDGCPNDAGGYLDSDKDGACEDDGADPLDIYPNDASRIVLADNTLPTALFTGLDPAMFKDVVATLDASGSSDANGDPITYAWSLTVPDGSAAVLTETTTVQTAFTPDIDGDYTVTLMVSDLQQSAPFSLTTTAGPCIGNCTPIAQVTSQQVNLGDSVTLDGSGSSDPNTADMLSYTWQVLDPNDSEVVLDLSDVIRPTYTPSLAGVYNVSLIVTDDATPPLSSPAATATVSVNGPPQADAGVSLVTNDITTPITITAVDSTDDGALTYTWACTFSKFGIDAGEVFTVLTAATNTVDQNENPTLYNMVEALQPYEAIIDQKPFEGTYTCDLTVNDGFFSDTDQVEIKVDKTLPASSSVFGLGLLGLLWVTMMRRKKQLSRQ